MKKSNIQELVEDAKKLKEIEELKEVSEDFIFSSEMLIKRINEFINKKEEDSKLVKMIKDWRVR